MSVHDDLQNIFRDILEEPDLVITDEMNANDVDKWDSLSHIQLIVAVEQFFNVKFKNAEIARLRDISDLKKLIDKKLAV